MVTEFHFGHRFFAKQKPPPMLLSRGWGMGGQTIRIKSKSLGVYC